MLLETLIWLVIVLLFIWLNAERRRFFKRFRTYKNEFKEYNDLKNKPSKEKTLEDKKEYVKKKTETGNDFFTTIISLVMFMIGYTWIIYPKITTMIGGLVISFMTVLAMSWIFSKIQFKGIIFESKFIESFTNYLLVTTFLVYVKFTETINPFILIGISFLLVILLSSKVDAMVESRGKL